MIWKNSSGKKFQFNIDYNKIYTDRLEEREIDYDTTNNVSSSDEQQFQDRKKEQTPRANDTSVQSVY